jgi:hypothetical protein
MFELTGTLTYVIPVMLSVLVAKTVADALEPKGIYDLVIECVLISLKCDNSIANCGQFYELWVTPSNHWAPPFAILPHRAIVMHIDSLNCPI